MLCLLASQSFAAEPQPAWNQKATRQYLDARVGWWLNWSSADRGQGTSCSSCHTTLPYAIALPALTGRSDTAPLPDVAARMLAGVRTRVANWDKLASAKPEGEDPLTPILGGARREVSLDTEAVLNAVILLSNEPAAKGSLSDSASKALDIMWARQQADGAWRWLELGLRPWEQDGDYFGATLAAVAIGRAGKSYPGNPDGAIQQKTAALQHFLKARLADKPLLHNHALALWSASYLPELFTADEKKSLIDGLFAAQSPDGGWSMRDLGKTRAGTDKAGWKIVRAYPPGAVSDGYATGLVVLALRQAGVPGDDERLRRGMMWLLTHQAADGTWPTVWVNKERDPESNIGKFNRDAGAAFAALALSGPN
jgi:squalene-hopene/tetraprenyl-beta-curcumene cyclase